MWVIHGLRWPPIAPDSAIGGHEAMEPWDHPRAIGCHRWLSGPCPCNEIFIQNELLVVEYRIVKLYSGI